MTISTNERNVVLAHLNDVFGKTVTRAQLMEHYAKGSNNGILPRWLMADESLKAGRGVYYTWLSDAKREVAAIKEKKVARKSAKSSPPQPVKPDVAETFIESPVTEYAAATVIQMPTPNVPQTAKRVVIGTNDHLAKGTLIPNKFPTFVPFGYYQEVKRVIDRGVFFPVYISGLSGNGKTMIVEQACAVLGRELVRVQVTPETDEDDLIGGFRLINGETVWVDGPVVVAAQRGAICLIDEIDYGTGKISCLQGILEGKGIFIKKANRLVSIVPGFNIIATANTKGRGSEENGGRYINTNIMNEALLERFALVLEQEFPQRKVEKKILINEFVAHDVDEQTAETLAEQLTGWAETIRITFYNGGIEDVISTRRLVHIVNAYGIFGDIKKCVEMATARFDAETKKQFIMLFDKFSVAEPTVAPAPDVNATVVTNTNLDPRMATTSVL